MVGRRGVGGIKIKEEWVGTGLHNVDGFLSINMKHVFPSNAISNLKIMHFGLREGILKIIYRSYIINM